MVDWDKAYLHIEEAKKEVEAFISESLTGNFTRVKLLNYPPRLEVITYFNSASYLMEFIEVLVDICGVSFNYEWEKDDSPQAIFTIKPNYKRDYGF